MLNKCKMFLGSLVLLGSVFVKADILELNCELDEITESYDDALAKNDSEMAQKALDNGAKALHLALYKYIETVMNMYGSDYERSNGAIDADILKKYCAHLEQDALDLAGKEFSFSDPECYGAFYILMLLHIEELLKAGVDCFSVKDNNDMTAFELAEKINAQAFVDIMNRYKKA